MPSKTWSVSKSLRLRMKPVDLMKFRDSEAAFAAQSDWHDRYGHPLADIISSPGGATWGEMRGAVENSTQGVGPAEKNQNNVELS